MIIFEALDFVRKELNAFVKKDRGGENRVVLSGMIAPDGSMPPAANNKIVLSLINVEREGAASPANFYTRSQNGGVEKINPTLNLNLYLLVAGNHQDYNESLKMISTAISFFQTRSVFTPENVPAVTRNNVPTPFPKGLQRLTFEVFNLKMQDMSHLWGALGTKYQPSIIYKVRMFTFQEAWVTEERPAIKGSDASLGQ